jgi:hypothetical protein
MIIIQQITIKRSHPQNQGQWYEHMHSNNSPPGEPGASTHPHQIEPNDSSISAPCPEYRRQGSRQPTEKEKSKKSKSVPILRRDGKANDHAFSFASSSSPLPLGTGGSVWVTAAQRREGKHGEPTTRSWSTRRRKTATHFVQVCETLADDLHRLAEVRLLDDERRRKADAVSG